jgi:hypothetical protein
VRRIPITACVILSISCLVLRADQAETRPAASDESISALIDRLADPDPAQRDAAGKSLWALGHPAEPALRKAAAEGNPEIARRAKAILRDFTYGLYPDAPHEIFTLLDQYRKGDPQEKRAAVLGLGGAGVPGIRVLLKLREEERDPNWKGLISQILTPREHEVSALMLADGQAADVEQMLERSAFDSPVAAQDYAALLLFNGKLKDTLATLKVQPITDRSAPVLVALARAAGDPATARAAAEKSSNPDLLDAILTEQGDWAALAARLAAGRQRLPPAERLGYLCAYYRLAGDQKNADATAAQIIQRAASAPQDYEPCAENLFLNDHPEQALAVLAQHDDFLQLSNYLAPRLQFAEALNLPRQADQGQAAAALQVKARTVGTLLFLGQTQQARDMMTGVVAENRIRNDFETWVALVESARESGLKREADEFAVAALEKATRESPLAMLFDKLRLGDDTAVVQWWQFFRQQNHDEPVAETLHRLHALFDGAVPEPELEKLSEMAHRYAVDLPVAERAAFEQTVADTLAAAGRDDLASKWIERLEGSGILALIHAGDYRADRKDWAVAARDYDRAWEHDRTRADALYLRGWALSQAGQAQEGANLMQRARELPLGSGSARFELAETLSRHKLKDEARKQLELVLQITPPRSWERNEALRRSAEDLAADGHELLAAERWDRAFLQNLANTISFSQPWANVIVPALVHKTRAVGLIKGGHLDAALAEANLSLTEAPGDADAVIELVNALDATGHRPEADAFYAAHTAQYRKLIETYPHSGPLHNQLAWAQVMCHRELDEALTNGKLAVELEPTSTASMDTLAEVYFARHDPAKAAAQMQNCISLEPKVERHRAQLARFLAATTQPQDREKR